MNTVDLPWWTTRPVATNGPGFPGEIKLILSSRVAICCCTPPIPTTTYAIAASSIPVRMPPWTMTSEWQNSGRAQNCMVMVCARESKSATEPPSKRTTGGMISSSRTTISGSVNAVGSMLKHPSSDFRRDSLVALNPHTVFNNLGAGVMSRHAANRTSWPCTRTTQIKASHWHAITGPA